MCQSVASRPASAGAKGFAGLRNRLRLYGTRLVFGRNAMRGQQNDGGNRKHRWVLRDSMRASWLLIACHNGWSSK